MGCSSGAVGAGDLDGGEAEPRDGHCPVRDKGGPDVGRLVSFDEVTLWVTFVKLRQVQGTKGCHEAVDEGEEAREGNEEVGATT